jgi:hypothetical protein
LRGLHFQLYKNMSKYWYWKSTRNGQEIGILSRDQVA